MQPGRPWPTALWRLYREIRRPRPALLQTWLPHSDLLGFLIGRAAGVHTICWNVRSAELARADHPASLFAVLKMLAWLSARPACVVSNSTAGRRAHESIGYRPRRWEVIPNGVDASEFSPSRERRCRFRERLGFPEATPLVGLVGRFHAMKDHGTFIDAAAIVARARPDVRFVMVGRGINSSNAQVAEPIARRDLTDACILVDERTNTSEIFPAFDVAVSSSYSEAFPNVVAEAMACGVPCVVTDVGESAAIVGDTGVVVPAPEPGGAGGRHHPPAESRRTGRGRHSGARLAHGSSPSIHSIRWSNDTSACTKTLCRRPHVRNSRPHRPRSD